MNQSDDKNPDNSGGRCAHCKLAAGIAHLEDLLRESRSDLEDYAELISESEELGLDTL